MPFIPHTQDEVKEMLRVIGADEIEDLFDEIPIHLRSGELHLVPPALTEMETIQLMSARAALDSTGVCFLGAGAYEHHIPAAVWDLVGRGEFMTAYTPYQAEASQGTLQVIYEYQTMMAKLTGMAVSNASVYDGASALAEAVLMAVRSNRRSKSHRVLCAGNVHPYYLSAARDISNPQGIEIEQVPFAQTTGLIDMEALQGHEGQDIAALVISFPSFFGGLDDVDQLTDWAHQQGALVIAVINPVALGILKAPGLWGETGADIVVGEGQSLGIPMASGGPYLGIMCCRKDIVRQMPGRIIGRTVDLDGKEGFTLTLQAREQHIRRAKATSNICTNQGLLMTAATIHMSLMGAEGLGSVARNSHHGLMALLTGIENIQGVEQVFAETHHFHEAVFRVPGKASEVLAGMAEQGILGGLDLGWFFPEMANCILVNVTECRTSVEIEQYAVVLADVVGKLD